MNVRRLGTMLLGALENCVNARFPFRQRKSNNDQVSEAGIGVKLSTCIGPQ